MTDNCSASRRNPARHTARCSDHLQRIHSIGQSAATPRARRTSDGASAAGAVDAPGGRQRTSPSTAATSSPDVYQGSTVALPKQPQEASPDTAWKTETAANRTKVAIAMFQVSLAYAPAHSHRPRNNSNSTTVIRSHRGWSNPVPPTGSVANWWAFSVAAVSKMQPKASRTAS